MNTEIIEAYEKMMKNILKDDYDFSDVCNCPCGLLVNDLGVSLESICASTVCYWETKVDLYNSNKLYDYTETLKVFKHLEDKGLDINDLKQIENIISEVTSFDSELDNEWACQKINLLKENYK